MFTTCALVNSSNNVFYAFSMFRYSLGYFTTENEAKICQGFPLSEIDTSLIYILPLPEFLNFLAM